MYLAKLEVFDDAAKTRARLLDDRNIGYLKKKKTYISPNSLRILSDCRSWESKEPYSGKLMPKMSCLFVALQRMGIAWQPTFLAKIKLQIIPFSVACYCTPNLKVMLSRMPHAHTKTSPIIALITHLDAVWLLVELINLHRYQIVWALENVGDLFRAIATKTRQAWHASFWEEKCKWKSMVPKHIKAQHMRNKGIKINKVA